MARWMAHSIPSLEPLDAPPLSDHELDILLRAYRNLGQIIVRSKDGKTIRVLLVTDVFKEVEP